MTVSSENLALRKRIDVWLETRPAGEPLPNSAAGAGYIDFEAHISTSAGVSDDSILPAHLERIRRKVEVSRELYARYTADFARPASDAPLSQTGRQRLAAFLLKVALASGDPRYLNTALKLLDQLPNDQNDLSASELFRLAREVMDAMVPLELAGS